MRKLVVEVRTGPAPGRRIPLDADVVRIGRAEDAQLQIRSPTIASAHAEIRREPGGRYQLVRLSANPIYINDKEIGYQAELQPGDVVELAPGVEVVLRARRSWFGSDRPATSVVSRSQELTPAKRLVKLLPIGVPYLAGIGFAFYYFATSAAPEGFEATTEALELHMAQPLDQPPCNTMPSAGTEGAAQRQRYKTLIGMGVDAERRGDWRGAVLKYEEGRLLLNDARCEAVRYAAVRLNVARPRAARIKGGR